MLFFPGSLIHHPFTCSVSRPSLRQSDDNTSRGLQPWLGDKPLPTKSVGNLYAANIEIGTQLLVAQEYSMIFRRIVCLLIHIIYDANKRKTLY